MPNTARTFLTAKAAADELEEVLVYLYDQETILEPEMRNSINLISGNLASLNRRKAEGLLTEEKASVERRNIHKGVLALLAELPTTLEVPLWDQIQKREKWGFVVKIAGIALLLGIVFFLIFQPKKNLHIEADLELDQLSFTFHEGAIDLTGKPLSEITLSSFELLSIQGDSVGMKEYGASEFIYPPSINPLRLTPFETAVGLGLPMKGDLFIESLPIEENAVVSLYKPNAKEEPRLLRMIVSHENRLAGRISYQNTLSFTPEQIQLEGIEGVEELFSPTDMTILAPQHSRRSIDFQTFPGIYTMDVILRDSIQLQGLDLLISDPLFYRKDENLNISAAISTVLGGEVRVQEIGQGPMIVEPLGEREQLNISSNEKLYINRIDIDEDGIYINLSGKVDKLRIGAERESYNPSWLDWMLHNHFLFFSSIGIFLLIFAAYLPSRIKKWVLAPFETVKKLSPF